MLIYDRICNGNSAQLDGILDCQIALNADVLIQLVQKAQSGFFGDRNFSSIIPIGHSEGSAIAQFMAQTAPDLVSILVLTGFTSQAVRAIPRAVISGGILPAAIGDQSLILDPTYLVLTNHIAAENFFYFGNYSSTVADFDYRHRGTFTAGELATILLGQVPAPKFTGTVLVINGQEDEIFCTTRPVVPLTGPVGQCGYGVDSYSARTSALFPNAESYRWYQINQTGHCVNLHETAQSAFHLVHTYLESQGY